MAAAVVAVAAGCSGGDGDEVTVDRFCEVAVDELAGLNGSPAEAVAALEALAVAAPDDVVEVVVAARDEARVLADAVATVVDGPVDVAAAGEVAAGLASGSREQVVVFVSERCEGS